MLLFLFQSAKINGKRGSAFVLLFEVTAYTGFFDFLGDASIASLRDAAPDLAAYVILKNPDDVVSTPIRLVHFCCKYPHYHLKSDPERITQQVK